MAESEGAPPNPGKFMQIGMGYMASKVLLTACDLDLFTILDNDGPSTGGALAAKLGFGCRRPQDFFDALVALGALERDGTGPEATYRNTVESGLFLNRNKPDACVAGLLSMFNQRLYGFWDSLPEALRTDKPQNEIKTVGKSLFESIYHNEADLETFSSGMSGVSAGPAMGLLGLPADVVDWSKVTTVLDIGGAQGKVAMMLANAHSHITGLSGDLPPLAPIVARAVAAFAETTGNATLTDRVRHVDIDFFKDETLPAADLYTAGHILHDWGLEQKKAIIQLVFNSLKSGGSFLAYDMMIDAERRAAVPGLLLSLTMLIETPAGFDYSVTEVTAWFTEAGFVDVKTGALGGPHFYCVGTKP